jgi:hypothetical protein
MTAMIKTMANPIQKIELAPASRSASDMYVLTMTSGSAAQPHGRRPACSVELPPIVSQGHQLLAAVPRAAAHR